MPKPALQSDSSYSSGYPFPGSEWKAGRGAGSRHSRASRIREGGVWETAGIKLVASVGCSEHDVGAIFT